MLKEKSIKKNMLMSLVLSAADVLFPLVTYSYVARVLTPVGTGKVAYVTSVLAYFSYIAMLGIPIYGLRESAGIRDDKRRLSHTVQELFILNLIMTIISYVLLFATLMLVPQFLKYKTLFVVMSMQLLLTTLGLEWVYKALEEYTYITFRSLVFKCISVALTFALVRTENDYVWYGFVTMFTASASYLFNFLNIRRHISWKKTGSYNLRKHIKPILTLFTSSIIITVYANFDISMLGFLGMEKEVGLYNAALKIKGIMVSLSTAITAVIIPRMVHHFHCNEIENAKRLIKKSFRASLLLAIPIASYVFIYAENVIAFVCGDGYSGAVHTLRVLSACVLPLILTNLFGNQVLIPGGEEKRYTKSVFVGLWIKLSANILLIPSLGAFGAAIGCLLTEGWNVFYMSGGFAAPYRKVLLKEIDYKGYIVALISSSVSSILSFGLMQQLYLIWQLVLTALVFFGTYYIILLIFHEPIALRQMSNAIRFINRFVQSSRSKE